MEIIELCQNQRFHEGISVLKRGSIVKRSRPLTKPDLIIQDEVLSWRPSLSFIPKDLHDVTALILPDIQKKIRHRGNIENVLGHNHHVDV